MSNGAEIAPKLIHKVLMDLHPNLTVTMLVYGLRKDGVARTY